MKRRTKMIPKSVFINRLELLYTISQMITITSIMCRRVIFIRIRIIMLKNTID